MKVSRYEFTSILLGIFAVICVVSAMTAFVNNDGTNTDLASKLMAPIQLFPEAAPSTILFEAKGFEFTEDDAISVTLLFSLISASTGMVMCFLAAKRRKFFQGQSVAFLFCSAALVLSFFEFGYLLTDA